MPDLNAQSDPKKFARQISEALGEQWEVPEAWQPNDQTAIVRYATNAGGRRVVTGLMLSGRPISADALRKIPIRAIEEAASGSTGASALVTRRRVRAMDPLARQANETPADFSSRVATYYRAWSGISTNPAADMARAYHVPVATVHSWIREARLRGYLQPGSRRKADRATNDE